MTSKLLREGYLLSDMTASGGKFVEVATITCNHCHRQIIRNPARVKDRHWCYNCDSYICDSCEVIRLVSGCVPLISVIDKIANGYEQMRIF